MSRRNAYKVYNTSEIVECADGVACALLRTIDEIYMREFFKSSNITKSLVALIEELIEGGYDELDKFVDVWRDVTLRVKVYTDWNVMYGRQKHFVEVKVWITLKDDYVGDEYDHFETYRVNIIAKS